MCECGREREREREKEGEKREREREREREGGLKGDILQYAEMSTAVPGESLIC